MLISINCVYFDMLVKLHTSKLHGVPSTGIGKEFYTKSVRQPVFASLLFNKTVMGLELCEIWLLKRLFNVYNVFIKK